jgi:hypothetical protein
MIVNPGAPGSLGVFLGEDGILYEVRELSAKDPLANQQLLLGDNTLYGLGETGALVNPGQYFLGEDGTLYRADAP